MGLPFVFVYLDDILVPSRSVGQHEVFQHLVAHGLIINPSKCWFGLPVLDFLGHRISADSVDPLSDKVQAVTAVLRPASVKVLQEFLGMVNFYNRFVPRAAHLLQPLYAVLKGKTSKDPVDWSPDRICVFSVGKSALANAALLAHPSPSAEIALTINPSDVALGAVLEHRVSSIWQPLAFFSHTLRDAERKYSVFLKGRSFTTYIDHKPLTFTMSKVSDPWSTRQQCQLAAILECTMDIQHVAGKSNLVADYLSRALASPIYVGDDYSAMATA